MKYLKFLIVSLLLIFLVSCSSANYVTEQENKKLSDTFVATYKFVNYSGDLHEVVRSGSIQAFQQDMIKGKFVKEDLIPALNEYHRVHKKMRKELEVWLEATTQGNEYDSKDYLFNLAERLHLKTRDLVGMVNSKSEIKIPPTMPSNIYKLYKTIKEETNHEDESSNSTS